MFERFTERARQVCVLAQDEARNLKHNYIGTEHILIGLLREEEGIAARVLDSLDLTVEEVRQQVARIVGRGDEVPGNHIPFTPRAKKVMELALREALSLGHNYIGTEHILLGLVRENEGVAARIMLDFAATPETVRNEIIRILSGPGRQQRAKTPPARPAPGPLDKVITPEGKVGAILPDGTTVTNVYEAFEHGLASGKGQAPAFTLDLNPELKGLVTAMTEYYSAKAENERKRNL